MSKSIEFENALSELITEMFESETEIKEALVYFGNTTIAETIENTMDGLAVKP